MTRYARFVDNAVIRGTFENDVVYGAGQSGIDAGMRAGRDRFEGVFVSSHLNAGEDNDRFAGTSERDLFDRYQNAPDLVGDTRYDLNVDSSTLEGGDGADVFRLFGNGNRVEGDTGKDLITAYGSFDTINGGLDDDRIDAIVSHSMLTGGSGNDLFEVAGTDNRIVTGSGNDSVTLRLISGLRDDATTVDGGADSDYIKVEYGSALPQGLVITGGSGDDTLLLAGKDSRFYGGSGNDGMVLNSVINSTIKGNDGHDVIVGYGTTGSSISGGAVSDLLFLVGGEGNTLYGGEGGDELRVITSAEGTLVAGSNTVYGGDGGDSIFVNTMAAQSLFGDAGNDTLQGGDGADTLSGGLGIDRLGGGAGDDIFVYESRDDSFRLAGESITQADRILASAGRDVIDLSALGFTAIGVGDAYGTNDTLRLTYTGSDTVIENLDGVRHFTLFVQGYVDESDIRLGTAPQALHHDDFSF